MVASHTPSTGNHGCLKGLVTDVSGPQRNACPGTLTSARFGFLIGARSAPDFQGRVAAGTGRCGGKRRMRSSRSAGGDASRNDRQTLFTFTAKKMFTEVVKMRFLVNLGMLIAPAIPDWITRLLHQVEGILSIR